MKKRISEKDFYASSSLIKNLKLIVKTFFEKDEVDVYITSAVKTAKTDGKKVYLNSETHLVQEFATRELRFSAFMGMFYHEIAHVLFLDFDQSKKYKEQLAKGEFPAHAPDPANEEEETSLQELEAALKDPAYRKVLKETYHDIENSFVDNHDETAIIRKYGRSIESPILLIRNALYRTTPFADDLENEEPLEKMLSLIFTYARFGNIHGNEEVLRDDEDIAKLLPKRALLQQGAKTDSPFLRSSAINSLLLTLWPYIKDKAEDDAQEQKGKSWDELSDEEKNEIAEQMSNAIKQTAQQSGSSSTPQGKTSKSTKKVSAAADKKAQLQLAGTPSPAQTGSDPSGDPAEQANSAQQNFSPQSSSQEQTGGEEESEAENSAAEATSGMFNTVEQEETKRQEQIEAEKGQITQLGKEAKEVLVGSKMHKNIKVRYNRNMSVSEQNKMEYERVMDCETKNIVRKLVKSIGAVIREVSEEDERRNLPCGSLIFAEEAYRRDKKFFGDRRLPGDTPDIALSILVDESGSMSGSKRNAACKAATMLYEFATGLHFPVCVAGHSVGGTDVVEYNLFADFDNISNLDRYRLMKISSDNCNRDGCAIEVAAAHLNARPEKIKMLIVVSDGIPNDPYATAVDGLTYEDDVALTDVKNIVRKWRKAGIEIVSFAINCASHKDSFDYMYGKDSVVDVENVAMLPKKMTQLFKKRVEKEL